MRGDFNRHLIRDGTVAGYALFEPERRGAGAAPASERHPHRPPLFAAADDAQHHRRTVHAEQAQHHLRLIREHLLFPDGARLMDRPVPIVADRSRSSAAPSSAAFFGREIGLMYVHAHLRYGEAMAVAGRGRCTLGGAAGGQSDHRHRAAGPRVAAPAQRLFQQQRRRLSRPLSSAAPNGRGSRRERSRSTAAGASIRAVRAYTPICSLVRRFGIRRRFGERIVDPVLPPSLGPYQPWK